MSDKGAIRHCRNARPDHNSLVNHPAVGEAEAIGVPDPIRGEALTCYYVLKQGQEATASLAVELQEKVARSLG